MTRRAGPSNLVLTTLVAALAAACGDGSLDLVPLVPGADASSEGASDAAESDATAEDVSDANDAGTDSDDGEDARDEPVPLCGAVVCRAPTPVCDRASSTCVQCLVSTDCAIGHCESTHHCEL